MINLKGLKKISFVHCYFSWDYPQVDSFWVSHHLQKQDFLQENQLMMIDLKTVTVHSSRLHHFNSITVRRVVPHLKKKLFGHHYITALVYYCHFKTQSPLVVLFSLPNVSPPTQLYDFSDLLINTIHKIMGTQWLEHLPTGLDSKFSTYRKKAFLVALSLLLYIVDQLLITSECTMNKN